MKPLGFAAAMIACMAFAAEVRAATPLIPTAWVQAAPDGWHVRALSPDDGACPQVLQGRSYAVMDAHALPTADFPDTVCDTKVAPGSIRVAGRDLPPIPSGPIKRVAVLGDTGCRLKAPELQACNDRRAWPFPLVAANVANEHPDLIIHVGDYYYRESACPTDFAGCTGTPHGDAQPSWSADWFGPAQPLFGAAPLVLVRGNHEDCRRGGIGWFRYLDPGTSTACVGDTAPYAVKLNGLSIVVFDDADADDATPAPAEVATLHGEMQTAAALASGETWLVMHRPVYGITQLVERDQLLPLNATMQAAAGDMLSPFEAILAGHIHAFETLSLDGRPPVVVNGMGGDRLDVPITATVVGTSIGGVRVRDFASDARFGYAIYDRIPNGWAIALHAVDGAVLRRCTLGAGSVRCS